MTRSTTWITLTGHWLATSLASVGVVMAAPARLELGAIVVAVAIGAVFRRVPLLGDPNAPLEQLSGKQSVLIVVPAFPIALVFALALLRAPWVHSAPAALLCATVFCLGLMNMAGHWAARRRERR